MARKKRKNKPKTSHLTTRRKLIYTLIAAVGTLLFFEGFARMVIPRDQLLFCWERPGCPVDISAEGIMQLRPGIKETRRDGTHPWRIATNKLGLREDEEHSFAKPAGTKRFLALGDSWIFGYSLDQEETIPERLEQLLRGRVGAPEVEVINAGVLGYGGFDMLMSWKRLSTAFEIDGLILGRPHNDGRTGEESVAEYRRNWYNKARKHPASWSRLYLAMRRVLFPLLPSPYSAGPAEGSALQASIHDVSVLAEDALERGLPVWFVDWPTNMDGAMARPYAGEPSWRAALEPLGVIFIGHGLPERACWGEEDTKHPGNQGARALSELIAARMVSGESMEKIAFEPRCGRL